CLAGRAALADLTSGADLHVDVDPPARPWGRGELSPAHLRTQTARDGGLGPHQHIFHRAIGTDPGDQVKCHELALGCLVRTPLHDRCELPELTTEVPVVARPGWR